MTSRASAIVMSTFFGALAANECWPVSVGGSSLVGM